MRLILVLVLFVSVSSAQQDPARLLNDAIQAQQRGDYESAITQYRKLLEVRPDNIEAKVNLGACLSHVGRYDEAVATYRSVLGALSNKNMVLLDLGLAYYKKGDLGNARDQFAALHQSQPGNIQAAILLADTETKLGVAESAVNMLQPLEAANAANPDFDYELGLAMIKSGRRREGIPRVEKAGQLGHSGDAYMLAGATLLDLNEYEPARHDLEAALQLSPRLHGLHTLVGVARDKTGDQKAAEPAFRQALQENPDDFEANLYLGALLYKQRHLDEARIYLDRAVKLRPDDSMARYESAMLKSTSGDYAAAAAELEGVIKDNPDWLEPHVELTSLYYKLHRPADGAKERAIVDRLTAAQQAKGPGK
ncbi:MAG TPA: tetratricopeptide repeat protein [Verrucomicrobiae bacterium]|nr:tetratricopeptide repeat protein [Verrucomicrobiae bacterium]